MISETLAREIYEKHRLDILHRSKKELHRYFDVVITDAGTFAMMPASTANRNTLRMNNWFWFGVDCCSFYLATDIDEFFAEGVAERMGEMHGM